MDDGILKEVLQLEQKIEAELARERQQAELWLAETCRAIDHELSCEQEDSASRFEQQEADALRSARKEAAQTLRNERNRARTLAGLSTEAQQHLLQDRLTIVLTGRDNDHSDGKS